MHIYAYTHVPKYVNIYKTYISTHPHTQMHAPTGKCTYANTRMYGWMNWWKDGRMCTCTRVYVCMYVCMYMYVCIYVCVCNVMYVGTESHQHEGHCWESPVSVEAIRQEATAAREEFGVGTWLATPKSSVVHRRLRFAYRVDTGKKPLNSKPQTASPKPVLVNPSEGLAIACQPNVSLEEPM